MIQEDKIIKKAERAYLKKICGFSYKEIKTSEEYDSDGQLIKSKKETTTKCVLPDSDALFDYLQRKEPSRWGSNGADDERGCGIVILPEVEKLE